MLHPEITNPIPLYNASISHGVLRTYIAMKGNAIKWDLITFYPRTPFPAPWNIFQNNKYFFSFYTIIASLELYWTPAGHWFVQWDNFRQTRTPLLLRLWALICFLLIKFCLSFRYKLTLFNNTILICSFIIFTFFSLFLLIFF